VLVEWGVASRAAQEGSPSGDGALVQVRGADVLVAAFDALGHGADASASAAAARAVLEAHPEAPLRSLPRLVHDRLRQAPRGVAMSLGLIEGSTSVMSWLGVGNVQGLVVGAETGDRRRNELALRGGIVGRNLPIVAVQAVPLRAGDLVVFATDGIADAFGGDVIPGMPPQQMADRILERHHRGHDDGLVLVAAFMGARHDR